MSSFQTALSSARFNRYLMWFSGLVLAAGVAFLLIKLVPGNDKTQVGADKGFVATLPAKSLPLTNAKGAQIKTYAQLDPQVRATIRTFLASAVARRHLDKAWPVIAPSMKQGYTLPVVVAREGAPDRSVSDRERRLDAVLPRLRVDEGDPPRGRRLGSG